MENPTEHLALKAHQASISLASAKDKQAWLALYAEDAVLQDPVGVSPFDPTGNGHQGKQAIEQFWDTVIGPSNVSLSASKRLHSGDHHCAVLQTAVNTLDGGSRIELEMVATYAVNSAGKITEMRAYWSFDALG